MVPGTKPGYLLLLSVLSGLSASMASPMAGRWHASPMQRQPIT